MLAPMIGPEFARRTQRIDGFNETKKPGPLSSPCEHLAPGTGPPGHLLSYSPRPALTAPATSARVRAPSAKDAHNMYQHSSDALEILTDHAEIQARIFRGAIAEKKGLKDFPFFCHARGGIPGPGPRARASGPGPGDARGAVARMAAPGRPMRTARMARMRRPAARGPRPTTSSPLAGDPNTGSRVPNTS